MPCCVDCGCVLMAIHDKRARCFACRRRYDRQRQRERRAIQRQARQARDISPERIEAVYLAALMRLRWERVTGRLAWR